MGREVRKVPKDWQHPKDRDGEYEPMLDGYGKNLAEFAARIASHGLEDAIEYFGGGPQKDHYMPDWPESERTHWQMYETTSEGTPISPVMESPEILARWLADNKASAFGGMTAPYEQWLRVCLGAYAPSAVIQNGHMRSGVEGFSS